MVWPEIRERLLERGVVLRGLCLLDSTESQAVEMERSVLIRKYLWNVAGH